MFSSCVCVCVRARARVWCVVENIPRKRLIDLNRSQTVRPLPTEKLLETREALIRCTNAPAVSAS